jgi:hypothetical protein
VQLAEAALDAACTECIVVTPSGHSEMPVSSHESAIAAVALADQRVQLCVSLLSQATQSQTRARATLAAAFSAARRVSAQVRE